MDEKRKVRNTKLTNGSMALNVQGSAVPKRRPRPEEKPQEVKKQKYEKYADLKYAPLIDFMTFAGLIVAVSLIAVICISYLMTYNEMKQVEADTRLANIELNSLRTENDNTENNLYSNIDLEKIRKIAIEKYGMVYPYENQVIIYKSVTNGYVRQYGDLKGNEDLGLVERILRLVNAR